MIPRIPTVNSVVFIGVDEKVELFVGFHQSRDHFHSVLKVHVVVGRTVNQQVGAFEFFDEVDGRIVVVSGSVLLWRAHEALGVNGVVKTPVGHRRHRDAQFKLLGSLSQTQRTHIPTVAPAHHADAVGVYVIERTEILGGVNEILGFEFAELQVGGVLEITAPQPRSAGVDGYDDESLLCEHLVPHVICSAPAVDHGVAAGSTVYHEHYGVGLRGVEITGFDHPVIQRVALGCDEIAEHLFAQAVFLQPISKGFVGFQVANFLSFRIVQRDEWRHSVGGTGVDEIAESIGKYGGIRGQGGGEVYRLFRVFIARLHQSRKILNVYSAGSKAVHRRREVGFAFLFVDAVNFYDIPAPGRDRAHFTTFHVEKIEVVETRLFGIPYEMLSVFQKLQIVVDLYIGVAGFGIHDRRGDDLRLAFGGVGQQEFQFALMPVHAHDGQHRGIGGPLDARHVLFGIGIEVHFLLGSVGEVVHEDAHRGIPFSRFGVLEAVFPGVKAGVHGHVEFLYFGFVEAVIGDAFSVGRPVESAVEGEFFLVHPIHRAVDDFSPFPVGRHTRFRAFGDVGNVQIVVAYECHVGGGGGEGSELLFSQTEIGDGEQLRAFHVVHVIIAFARVPVNRLPGSGEQQAGFGPVEGVIVDQDGPAIGGGHASACKQGVHCRSGFVRVFNDGPALRGRDHARVVDAVGHAAQSSNVFGAESP